LYCRLRQISLKNCLEKKVGYISGNTFFSHNLMRKLLHFIFLLFAL
jgi:hypothetical protein